MLNVSDLALARGGRVLFDQLEFSAGLGQRVGIVGPNGCGKSTLFAAICGEVEPERGKIEVPPEWSVAIAGQESPSTDQSALEFVMGGDAKLDDLRRQLTAAEADGDGHRQADLHREMEKIGGYAREAEAGSLLHGLGFAAADHERPVTSFSGGWRSRLALARSLLTAPDILLLDEPTNHLDLETIAWLAQWCQSYRGLILVVSHDRFFLDQTATQILWMDRPAPRYYQGNLSVAEGRRSQILSIEAGERAKSAKRAEELTRFVNRFRAKASKAKQAQSRLKMLERLTISAPIAQYSGYDFQFPNPPRVDSPVLNLDHADIGYGDAPVLTDVHFSLLPGDKVGLVGLNGAGKSTLIKALAGELEVVGRVESRNLKVGYYAQHQMDALHVDWTPVEHFKDLDRSLGEQEIRDFVGGFGFSGDHAVTPIGPRSGGEKARLALALLAWQRPNLLLLDEPTNHLDLQMRDCLSLALQEFPGAIVMVSHDRSFMSSLCDTFYHVGAGRVVRGDSADQVVPANPEPDSTQDTSVVGGQKARRQKAAADRERLKPVKNRATRLEREVEAASAELKEIRDQLADPQLYASGSPDSIDAMSRRAGELAERVEDLESQWLEALEELEAMEAAL